MSTEKKYIPNEDFYPAVRQTLAEGTDVDLTVTGNSMWPLLKHGRDRVVLRKAESIKKGDIVLFEALPSKYLLHRVTRVYEEDFETTGDFNTFRDGKFPEACVIGKAVRIIKKDRIYEVKSFFMRIYSSLWMMLFPLRKPLVRGLVWLSRVRGYIVK